MALTGGKRPAIKLPTKATAAPQPTKVTIQKPTSRPTATPGTPFTGGYRPPIQLPAATAPPATSQPSTASTSPAPASPPAAPFLTSAQQYKLGLFDASIAQKIAAEQARETQGTATTNAQLNAAKQTHDVNTDNTNQSTAARGLFQSSIRDADLNDIDATLAMRNNILNTNLQKLMTDATSAIGGLQTDWATTHNYYNTIAAANAQAQTPVLPAPGTAGTSPTPARPAQPAPVSNGFNAVPKPTAVTVQKPTTHQSPPKLPSGGTPFVAGLNNPFLGASAPKGA
jgi:hypothetical protein